MANKNNNRIGIPVSELKKGDMDSLKLYFQRVGNRTDGYFAQLGRAIELAQSGVLDSLELNIVYLTSGSVQYKERGRNFISIQ